MKIKHNTLNINKILIIYIILISIINIISCRNEPPPPKAKIETMEFDRERVTIKTGEEAAVKVTVKPNEAKRNETIEYTAVNEGIVEIKEASNDGFIIKGIRGGSTVITAKSELVTNYLEVIVERDAFDAQYIMLAEPVIELLAGERKTTQVSLYGGTEIDNSEFIFRPENGKDIIKVEVSANIAVITGLERGYQKINVSHPKAEFDSEIIVFVTGTEESVKYISSMSNVLVVPKDSQFHSFSVLLINGADKDIIDFNYEVNEGVEYIEIAPNANVCNIRALKGGNALVTVSHPKAAVEFNMHIIAYEEDYTEPIILADQTFILLNIGESVVVRAELDNADSRASELALYSYEIHYENEENIIELVQTNNTFYVRALKGGSALLLISHERTSMTRTVLIVVRNELIYRDDYYITTSQNVIITQAGDAESILTMQLVNGNNADANGFTWTIEDSSIADIETIHGTVISSRAVINSVFNAVAVITPKKAGTTRITVSHPKSEVDAAVLVKVYPRGTFAGTEILLTTGGILKVIKGTTENVSLNMAAGNAHDTGVLDWSTEDTAIAKVNTGIHSMNNQISGVSDGITVLRVNGEKLTRPFETMVISGSAEFIDSTSIIYVDSMYQKIADGQTIRIEVKDSQQIYSDSAYYTAVAEDTDLVQAVMVKNQLIMYGKSAGETKVRITHPMALNSITLHIQVLPQFISIDKPYYLSGPEITGVVRGRPNEIAISLVGAGEEEYGLIQWHVDDSGVLSIIANGTSAIITGRTANQQTRIKVSHPKAMYELAILVYVVETEAELQDKIVLGLNSEYYLMTAGEEKFITLITNATEADKAGLRWNIRYGSDIVAITGMYDAALIRALKPGNAEIEISHEKNLLPTTLYVSVVEAARQEKIIKGPAIIEIIKDEHKIFGIQSLNLTQNELMDIEWSIEDQSIAAIDGAGDTAYVSGIKKGITYVNIKQEALGYRHRATLVCANSAEELKTLYVMGVDESYHLMMRGEEKRIRLNFGSAGFPEAEKALIKWESSEENVIRIAGKGDNVTIIANAPGIGKVTASSAAAFNEKLELTFEVRALGYIPWEFRGYEKVIGLLIGDSKQIPLHLYEGIQEITSGYSDINYENSNGTIISVDKAANVLYVSAKAAGNAEITLKHPKVIDEGKIIVYSARTAEELTEIIPWEFRGHKKIITLVVGESEQISMKIFAAGKEVLYGYSQIGNEVENSGVISVNQADNIIDIQAISPGKSSVTIKHPNVGEDAQILVYTANTREELESIIPWEFRGYERIIGLVVGNSRQVIMKLYQGEREINYGYSYIRYSNSDDNIISYNTVGNIIDIKAKEAGQTTLWAMHDEAIEDAQILVYTANTEDELLEIIPWEFREYNRIIGLVVGTSEQVTMRLFAENREMLSGYSLLEHENEHNETITVNRVDNILDIHANSAGKCSVRVSHPRAIEDAHILVYTANSIEELEMIMPWKFGEYEKLMKVLIGETAEVRFRLYQGKDEVFSGYSLLNYENENPLAVKMICTDNVMEITAQEKGQSYITVSHPKVPENERAQILVRSLETLDDPPAEISMPYEFRGHEKIVELFTGQSRTLELTMYEGDKELLFGYSALTYYNYDDSIIEMNTADNFIQVIAKKNGRSIIEVNHPRAAFPARILVSVGQPDDYYPIAAERTNYLLQPGEKATIKLNTRDDSRVDEIQWGIENSYILEALHFNGNKEAIIQGRSPGQSIINITIRGEVTERIFITVADQNSADMSKYMMTENIIGLVKNTSKVTYIHTNLSGSEALNLVWESEDESIAAVSGNGTSAVITAKNAANNSQTFITVRYGNLLKRHILVYVCDSAAAVNEHKAMNVENRYIRAGRNEEIIIPVFYEKSKPTEKTNWISKYNNAVATGTELDNGDRLRVLTLNEGVEAFEAVNSGLSNAEQKVTVYIEVSQTFKNPLMEVQTPTLRYLTADKTIHIINPDDINSFAELNLSGVGMSAEDLGKTIWAIESGSNVVNITGNGSNCVALYNRTYSGTFPAEAIITARSGLSENIIRFKIIASVSRQLLFPRISGPDTVRVVKNGDFIYSEFHLEDSAQQHIEKFNFEIAGQNIISVTGNNNVAGIRGIITGTTLLKVSNSDPSVHYPYYVTIIVEPEPVAAAALKYISSQDSFSRIKVGESKILTIDLTGMNETEGIWTWSFSDTSAILTNTYVQLEAAGKQARITGKAELTNSYVTIFVKNTVSLSSLTLYVMVAPADSEIKHKYITVTSSVITVVKGQNGFINATLVNGDPGDDNSFDFAYSSGASSSAVIDKTGAGNQLLITPKSTAIPGQTERIKITCPGKTTISGSYVEVLVIIEADIIEDGKYISADTTLVNLKPGEEKTVRLYYVGGTAQDIFNFSHEILYNGNVVNNQNYVQISRSQDILFLKGLQDGTVTIRIKNNNKTLSIVVNVQRYDTIRFTQKNISIEAGFAINVEVEAPSGVAVSYIKGKYKNPLNNIEEDIVTIISSNNGNLFIRGDKPGVCVIYAQNASGSMKDELLVEVRPPGALLARYIQTPAVVYTMTDWQSALNRTSITAATHGEKDSKELFSELDDRSIIWEIEGNGIDCIGFDGATENSRNYIGKTVSIKTKKTGNAEIKLTHPEMGDEYRKKLYMNVIPFDANFRIEPLGNIFTQEHEINTINVIISNVKDAETEYANIDWYIRGEEGPGTDVYFCDERGIKTGNGTEIKGQQTVHVIGLKGGTQYRITAQYNGEDKDGVNLYVDHLKKLEILSDYYMSILPGETKEIEFEISPPGADVKISTDFNDFIETDYAYTLSERDGITVGTTAIKGLSKEGYTQITISANNIERKITAYTNFNYTFYATGYRQKRGNEYVNGTSAAAWKEFSEIRGRPGDEITVKYRVYPEKNDIQRHFIQSPKNDYFINEQFKVVDNINVYYPEAAGNREEHTIEFTLNECGYAGLVFESEYNHAINLDLIIPVYVYYEEALDIGWNYSISPASANGGKSRIDSNNFAIYIANNEKLTLDINRNSNPNETGWYYANINGITGDSKLGVEILESNITTIPNPLKYEFKTMAEGGRSIVSDAVDISVNRNTNKVEISGPAASIQSITGYAVLIDVKYLGTVTIGYWYYNGNSKTALQKFSRTFMVYGELWGKP